MMLDKEKVFQSKVFTPKVLSNLSNQENYRLNFLNEFMAQQLKQNENLNQSLVEVSESVRYTHSAQKEKIEQVLHDQQLQRNQTDLFKEKVESQGKTSEKILSSICDLKDYQMQLNECMENEKLINQAILDQLNFQDNQLRQTNDQLVYYATLAGELSEQLIVQGQLLKEMEEKLQLQDIYHQTVMNKLDSQEALNEKIIRQLDQLKLIIHERINSTIEKIESSFQSTSNYIANIFDKSGFTKPFLLASRPKEKNEIENKDEEANKLN